MGTAQLAGVDGTGTVPANLFPASIATTAGTVAVSSVGVASGVATLGPTSTLDPATLTPGDVITVYYDGVAWPAGRPTARTDVTVWAFAPSGVAAPGWLIVNDRFDVPDVG